MSAETQRVDVNLYHDAHSGGWILEVLALGEWYVAGVFGTRAAAIASVGSAQ